ncbi:hypothetical protein ACNSTU_11255 [Aquisalimonas sp. APHAB1-3]|uniref:hypothetical protein n=1 Tax=Aquisalimonas sp. APHAB1-3 TaxID=3402080 RepID=UPI003AAAF9AA
MIIIRGIIGPGANEAGAGAQWLGELTDATTYSGHDWSVAVVPDCSHRIDSTGTGLAIHDGRVQNPASDPREWNGAYLAVHAQSGELTFTADRLGTVPVYWTRVPGGVAFASRLVDMVSWSPRPNSVGILQMLLLNQPLGVRTLLENVALLPPASQVTLTADGVQSQTRYWEPTVSSEPPGNLDAWIEEGAEVLEKANHRARNTAQDGRVAWPVTGGFDSRCNLGVSRSLIQPDDLLFHVVDLGNFELPAARQIASYLDRPLHIMDAAPWMRNVADFDIGLDNGEFNVGHWRLVGPCRELMDAHACRVTVDGFLQGILLNPAMFFKEGTVDDVRERQLRLFQYRMQRLAIPRDHSMLETAREASAADYPVSVDGLSASQRYIFENRSRRMVYGIVRLNQNYVDVRTPGLDTELLDFVIRVPWELRKHARLYRKIINRVDPRLASIVHDKTGLPVNAEKPLSRRKFLVKRLRYYVNRVWPGKPLFRGKETRFETLVRTDAAFREEVCALLRQSHWLTEALQTDPVAMLDAQKAAYGEIDPDCVGAMVNIALLEKQARSAMVQDAASRVATA